MNFLIFYFALVGAMEKCEQKCHDDAEEIAGGCNKEKTIDGRQEGTGETFVISNFSSMEIFFP